MAPLRRTKVLPNFHQQPPPIVAQNDFDRRSAAVSASVGDPQGPPIVAQRRSPVAAPNWGPTLATTAAILEHRSSPTKRQDQQPSLPLGTQQRHRRRPEFAHSSSPTTSDPRRHSKQPPAVAQSQPPPSPSASSGLHHSSTPTLAKKVSLAIESSRQSPPGNLRSSRLFSRLPELVYSSLPRPYPPPEPLNAAFDIAARQRHSATSGNGSPWLTSASKK